MSIHRKSMVVQIALFLAAFAVMQWGWTQARGTAVERAMIDTLTVTPAVSVINALTPDVRATADGSRIRAPGGGINILNGCEGTGVMFLLVAAFMVARLPWRTRLTGVLAGLVMVMVLNQARVLALFYSFRGDKALFNLLHGLIAPLALVIVTTVFFFLWCNYWDARREANLAIPATR